MNVKTLLKAIVPEQIKRLKRTHDSLKPFGKRDCNICGYHGWFDRFGRPPRIDAACPKCGSLERHRLFYLALESGEIRDTSRFESDRVLHFAVEAVFKDRLPKLFNAYATADLFRPADYKLDVENIELPDEAFEIVIINHVLEHVDDRQAAKELYRILSPGGLLVCMVPIIEGWQESYENAAVSSVEDRWLHFGQYDHVRYFGSDFRERILSAGFTSLKEVTAEGPMVIKHGLLRGEKVFIFQK